MNKHAQNQKIDQFFKLVKPWIIMIAVFIILRYTGMLGHVAYAAQTVLMQTGVMNAQPSADSDREDFDYDFSVRDLKGNVVNVEEFKGKVVFLNLWATWCGPCRAEMPSIQKLHESIQDESIAFVMLSLDKPENFKKVISYVEKNKYTFPVYIPGSALPSLLDVPSIPTTFIIGKDGKVKMKKIGTANYDTDDFREYLRRLAAE